MSKINLKPAATLREPAELVAHGLAPVVDLPDLEKVAARYAVAVTPDMAGLIDPDDPDDPIARQFIPSAEELIVVPGENADPIGDQAHSPVSGIVHRYPDRVLFKLVHVCAVYCRFCFRREMVGPGKATALSAGAYDNALAYIRAHSEIWEVILTGGDPLMLSPRRLAEIMADIAGIDHVKIIRIHTRVPVVEPSRISEAMITALKVEGATNWVALHANHARELSGKARAACAEIVDAGIPMVSQSVLLRGVNDNPAALEDLMRAFVECRIKPYYLHHGDLAPGTAHLRTALAHGQELMRTLRGRVSGLCQPEYVLDVPGGHGKAPVGPSYLSQANSSSQANSCSQEREQSTETRYRIVDYCGDVHLYPPEPWPKVADGEVPDRAR
jgi:lysine 2,3-aminomutase